MNVFELPKPPVFPACDVIEIYPWYWSRVNGCAPIQITSSQALKLFIDAKPFMPENGHMEAICKPITHDDLGLVMSLEDLTEFEWIPSVDENYLKIVRRLLSLVRFAHFTRDQQAFRRVFLDEGVSDCCGLCGEQQIVSHHNDRAEQIWSFCDDPECYMHDFMRMLDSGWVVPTRDQLRAYAEEMYARRTGDLFGLSDGG